MISHQTASDAVRLGVLSRYGGAPGSNNKFSLRCRFFEIFQSCLQLCEKKTRKISKSKMFSTTVEPKAEVWLDVNILVCGSLDELCWNAIGRDQKPACVFFHPSYGTEALGGQDFVESWCLATKPQNPFFLRWRDTFKARFAVADSKASRWCF